MCELKNLPTFLCFFLLKKSERVQDLPASFIASVNFLQISCKTLAVFTWNRCSKAEPLKLF